jgi:predicted RNase H-like nuclease (RuvC/YqgF family)
VSFVKLENQYKTHHSLENTIEEFTVENRKLQNLLKQQHKKYTELQSKHNQCDKKRKELKEYTKKLGIL